MPPVPSSFTYKIQAEGHTLWEFKHIGIGNGYYALDFQLGAPVRVVDRFHPKGVLGNITVLDTPSGLPIMIRGLIVGSLSGVWAAFYLAMAEWRGDPCTITDPGGLIWTKCTMVDGKMLTLHACGTDEVATGDVELEFTATFTKDSDF